MDEIKHEILVTKEQAALLLDLLQKSAVPIQLGKISGKLLDAVTECVVKFEGKS